MRMMGLIALTFAFSVTVSFAAFSAAEPVVVAQIEVDMPLKDPSICRDPDGVYYLTGTVSTQQAEDGSPNWYENDGVYMWKSSDLKRWESMGCVMAFRDQQYELYGPYRWLHKMQVPPDRPARERVFGAVAPEIHHARDTFWLTISMTRQGTAIMRSTSGKAEGPYELVDLLTTRGGDPSLFVDGGDLWWVFGAGYMSKLKRDEPGEHTPQDRKPGTNRAAKREWTFVLAGRPELMRPEPEANGFPLRVGTRGAFMVRSGDRCHLVATEPTLQADGTAAWDTFVASAERPDGPYGKRRLLIPGGGQATLFRDAEGRLLAACAVGCKVGDSTDRLVIVEVQL
jgi:hypothetical protein